MSKDINNDNSFWIRLRSSIILTVVTVSVMCFGGYVLAAVLALVTIKGMSELYRVYKVEKSFPAITGYVLSVIWIILIMADGMRPAFLPEFLFEVPLVEAWFCLSVIYLIILLAVYVFKFGTYDSEKIMALYFGFFYVALMLSFILRMRLSAGGAYTVWLIFIASWGSDTFAYLVGRRIGKHKIAPVLSPKKSLEGCIGGIVGSVLLAVVYALIFKDTLSQDIPSPVICFAVAAFVASPVSMIGDMAASGIKRNNGIKDYGTLIPGHGGILDRFDSVIILAPVIWFVIGLFN